MEQPGYLIDTNVLIDYLANKLTPEGMDFMNSVINTTPNISIITKIELLGFNASEEYITLLSNFVDDAFVLDLTSDVSDLCIAIRRSYKTKLPDAIIAATAMAGNMILITRNVSDFKVIQGIQLLDPYDL